jgi:hypothetical protein
MVELFLNSTRGKGRPVLLTQTLRNASFALVPREAAMSEEQKPMTKWQECKAIVEALAPAPPPDPEGDILKLRAAMLAQIAARGEKGAALAVRVAEANFGPIHVAPEEWPDGLLEEILSVPPEKRRSL